MAVNLLKGAMALGLFAAAASSSLAGTTLNYTGNEFTSIDDAVLGSSLDAVVALNGTLAANFTGTLTDVDIASFTLTGIGGTGPSVTTSNGRFEDIEFSNGAIVDWTLAARSPLYGGILFETSPAEDTIEAFLNDGTLPDSTQNYNFGQPGTWTIATAGVPEPASWALMLVGIGTLGFALRRGMNHAPTPI